MSATPIKNRVTEITGTAYPIIQAPMSWIARAQLASAVCNAGGMGIIETGSVSLTLSVARSGKCESSLTSPLA